MQLMDALAELPADLLLFHVCLPLTVPYLNLRSAAHLQALRECHGSSSLCIPVNASMSRVCTRGGM